MAKIPQRMGDGTIREMTETEIKKDIEEGTEDAAERAGVPPLSEGEIKYLFDLYISPSRCVGVGVGNEVVLSSDGSAVREAFGPLGGGCGAALDCGPQACAQLAERVLAWDIIDFGHSDFSFKPVKGILPEAQVVMETASLIITVPATYGAMPNLGLYTKPDGPFPSPIELLTKGMMNEAREVCVEMAEMATRDIVYVAGAMYEAGADGLNFDTTGAYGDVDFWAALRATEILKKKYPDMGIEMGMAGEFILGVHGELTYDGVRLAGLYPHQQVELAEKAGVTIFGPAMNINGVRSCVWNLARVLTYLKPCCERSHIPIHNCMGMGVGGIPLSDFPPVDAVTRASKACVEICGLDGL